MLPVYVSVALLRCGPSLHLCPCCGTPRSSAVLWRVGALAQLRLVAGGGGEVTVYWLQEFCQKSGLFESGVLFESPPTVAATAPLGPHLRPPSLPLHP